MPKMRRMRSVAGDAMDAEKGGADNFGCRRINTVV